MEHMTPLCPNRTLLTVHSSLTITWPSQTGIWGRKTLLCSIRTISEKWWRQQRHNLGLICCIWAKQLDIIGGTITSVIHQQTLRGTVRTALSSIPYRKFNALYEKIGHAARKVPWAYESLDQRNDPRRVKAKYWTQQKCGGRTWTNGLSMYRTDEQSLWLLPGVTPVTKVEFHILLTLST